MGTWNVPAERLLLAVGQVSLTTALVILPLLALRRLLRKRYPARVLCLVWAVLVVRLLVPVQLSLPEAPVQVTPHLTRVRYAREIEAEALPGTETPLVVSGSHGWVETAEVPELENAAGATYYGALLFLLWAGVALWLLDRQLRAYFAFSRQLRRTARAVTDPALLDAYRGEAARLGLLRAPPLLRSPMADGPMLAGLLRPVLLLPEAGPSPDAAPMVFRHELAHYRRHDLWLKLAAAVARCAHWFNPAVHLLVRALYEDIELACDSRAVEGMDSEARRRYGMAILDCAASQSAARQPLTTCFTSDRETLRTRLGELFVTGTKKRGAALLAACVLTVGIAGGAVSIGGGDSGGTPASEEDILQSAELTGDTAALLAGAWSDGWVGRDMEPAMAYLTADFRKTVFDSMLDPETDAEIVYDPEDPHYGVPEGSRSRFWNVGVSSPWMRGRAVIPDVENGGAYVVYNWQSSATPDVRTMEYVHFTREGGEWRISSVDGSDGRYGAALDDVPDSADKFLLLYGNDLGLPAFLHYADFVSAQKAEGSHDLYYYRLDDPVTAAVDLLQLEGGSGEVTGQATVGGYEHSLGSVVTYTFADGSAVDIVMSSQYGEGYIPVDWRIGGKNTRTMLDLASQWAHGTMHKDTHVMFPLLTEAGTEELIEIQKAYSGGGEWYWKHGKYGSSPTAWEYGVFFDMGEGTARIVYELGSNGDIPYRESELLRFADTPAGLKIDSVRELTRYAQRLDDPMGYNGSYELIDCSEAEWFAMHYLAEPAAGSLTEYPSGRSFGTSAPEAYSEDPLEAAKALLHITDSDRQLDGETHASAALVFQSDWAARVRLDFQGGGSVYVTLGRSPDDGQGWQVTEMNGADAPGGVRSASVFKGKTGSLTDFSQTGSGSHSVPQGS